MYRIESRTLIPHCAAVERATLTVPEIGAWTGRCYHEVSEYVATAGRVITGPPFSRYRRAGDRFEVEAGFPIDAPIDGEGRVEASSLPGGLAATTWHRGPYEGLGAAYDALDAWLAERGATPTGPPWEIYYSDPARQPDPATWRTEVVQPYTAT